MLIGTATVIGVASIFKGLDQQMVEMAQGFGTRTLYIYKFQPGIHFNLTREQRLRKPLTYEQGMAIKQLPAVESVAVETASWGPAITAKYKGLQMVDAQFQGNTAEDFRITNSILKDGRLFTDIDDIHRRDVAVIGADVVERLFLNEDPIGKEINVDGNTFQVIGTLEKRKAFLGDNGDDKVIFVPYFTYMKLYPSTKENFLTALAFPGRINQATDEITGLLRRLRNDKLSAPDSFGIATADTFIKQFRDMMGTVVLVAIVISSIGLMVGGIGVMNIMLVSVTERTREIGVRKAIGARSSDITLAVPAGGHEPYGSRWSDGNSVWLYPQFPDSNPRPHPAFHRSHVVSGDRVRCFGRHRPLLRPLARHESRPPRPHCGLAL